MDFTNVIAEAMDKAIDTYLQSACVTPDLHIATIVTSGLLSGGKKKGKSLLDMIESVDVVTSFLTSSASLFGLAQDLMNETWDALRDPNIEGIPIAAPSIKVSRDSDVSEYPVISEYGMSKLSIIDTCCPHPRKWTISGYLTSISALDDGFTIKSSLITQVLVLDAFQRSRRPLWFKTADCEFYQVLISSMTIEDTAESSTTKKINIELVEWFVIEADNLGQSMSSIPAV